MTKADKLTEWFDLALRESYEFYIDDIRHESPSIAYSDEYESRLEEEMAEANCETEEDFLDYLCEGYDDAMEWYIDNFGAEEFGMACLVALGYKSWSDFRR